MRRGQMHGAGDQRDLRARQARRARNGKAHLAAGAVGEAPHEVDGFKRRPGRDHHAAARQCLRGERGDDFLPRDSNRMKSLFYPTARDSGRYSVR